MQQTFLLSALTLAAPVNVAALPTTACVTTSPPVGRLGWLPGCSTFIALSTTSTGWPPILSLDEVSVAVAERATYTNTAGTGPAGGVGGTMLVAGGPGETCPLPVVAISLPPIVVGMAQPKSCCGGGP